MRLFSIIDAITYAYQHDGVTTFRATCEVICAARELGYPAPLDTGVWANDLPGILSLVGRRLREVI